MALAAPKDNETFHFGNMNFDVKVANDLIQLGIIKAPVEQLPVESYIKAMGVPLAKDKPLDDKNQQMPMFVGINWQHAAKLTQDDLKTPGILAETKIGHLLIDGNHRLVRSAYDGLTSMPVRVIAKKYLTMITPNTAAYIKAKKLIKAKSIYPTQAFDMQGDVSEKFFGGPVLYDQKHGIGNVPDNQEVKNKGFAVMMKPSKFLELATHLDKDDPYSRKSIDYIKKNMGNKGLGSPFLDVAFSTKGKSPEITSHDGRHRMQAILETHGDIPVLVHIFPAGGMKAKHITPENISSLQQKAYKQLDDEQKSLRYKKQLKKRPMVAGPNFEQRVWHLKGWTDVGEKPKELACLSRVLVTLAAGPSDINARYKKDLLGRIRDIIDGMDFFGEDLPKISSFETFLKGLDQPKASTPNKKDTLLSTA